MPSLAQRVFRQIRERDLLRAGERVGVAVSGGTDSVALLRLLLELREALGVVLSVLHVNHQIRGAEADADQKFVSDLAGRYVLPLYAFSAATPACAADRRLSLEAAARELRYEFFQRLLCDGVLDKVATAHTLDDQAETVLLRLTRGTGITGLAGIYPNWPIAGGTGLVATGALARPGERSSPLSIAAIVRPLLPIRRSELQACLRQVGQAWREDASNLDPQYARNRVRHRVLPLLESELNPRVRELLAETADIARAEEDYWAEQVSPVLAQVWTATAGNSNGALQIAPLRRLPLALARRLLRAAAQSLGISLDFQHVEEILALAQAAPGEEKQIGLAGGWHVLRDREGLHFAPPQAVQGAEAHDFAYALCLPGEVVVAETATIFRATVVPVSPERLGEAYNPACLPPQVQVRNWRPGDRFWPQHTRGPRKIKELLQERKIPQSQRRTWPVITSGASGQEQVIWLRGFPPPQELVALSGSGPALMIQEYALQAARNGSE